MLTGSHLAAHVSQQVHVTLPRVPPSSAVPPTDRRILFRRTAIHRLHTYLDVLQPELQYLPCFHLACIPRLAIRKVHIFNRRPRTILPIFLEGANAWPGLAPGRPSWDSGLINLLPIFILPQLGAR
jgi:hypothetical protein